jgi:hypothetical protein
MSQNRAIAGLLMQEMILSDGISSAILRDILAHTRE